jgi:hypothetical protein
MLFYLGFYFRFEIMKRGSAVGTKPTGLERRLKSAKYLPRALTGGALDLISTAQSVMSGLV